MYIWVAENAVILQPTAFKNYRKALYGIVDNEFIHSFCELVPFSDGYITSGNSIIFIWFIFRSKDES